MPDELLAIVKELGALGEAVAGLTRAQQDFREQWRVQDQNATDGRRVLYDKIDGVVRDVTELRVGLNTVRGQVETMGPVVRAADRAHLQTVGAGKLGKYLAWLVIALVSAFAREISAFFSRLLH